MDTRQFDVVAIGAGPAGSRTAARIAQEGFSALLLEKRERVGYPIRCAEAVGPRSAVERYLPLDESLISAQIDGVLVVAPDGTRFEAAMPAIGYTVDRELFDRRLAEAAVVAGAELRTGHQAVGLLQENGTISGVRIKDLDTSSEYNVTAKVVVGADGVEALSPRWAGLKKSFRPEEIFSCAQELIEGIEVPGPFIEFHLGTRFAPGGYAWVFPKGNGKANVGVGINSMKTLGRNALDYLNDFINPRCPAGIRRRLVIGGCAVARGLPSLAADGFIAVGEAAHQNNPFSGGGIINALEGADMAAEAIIQSLRNGTTSAKSLGAYTKQLRKSVGKTNEVFYQAARIFYELSDKELNSVIRKAIKVPGIFDEKGVKPVRMLLALLLSHPVLLFRYLRAITEGSGST